MPGNTYQSIRYNGKTYRFTKLGSKAELEAKLAAIADEVSDSPEKPVYTHDTAACILEAFEDLLEDKGIMVPCADPDEETDRGTEDENGARIYGSEYSGLLDRVESELCSMLEDAGVTGYVQGEFSGDF